MVQGANQRRNERASCLGSREPAFPTVLPNPAQDGVMPDAQRTGHTEAPANVERLLPARPSAAKVLARSALPPRVFGGRSTGPSRKTELHSYGRVHATEVQRAVGCLPDDGKSPSCLACRSCRARFGVFGSGRVVRSPVDDTPHGVWAEQRAAKTPKV